MIFNFRLGKILATFSVFTLLFCSGCAGTDTVSPNIVFAGEWIYAGPSRYSGVDRMQLVLSIKENGDVQGTFDALRDDFQSPAANIDTGTVTGNIAKDTNIMTLKWTGDRNDTGTANVSYDSSRSVLVWNTTVEQDDGLFTIPLEMGLVRNNTKGIGGGDQSAITDTVLREAARTMGVTQDFLRAEIDLYTGKYARVNIQPADSVTDPAFWYVALLSGVWQTVGENNVPLTLMYY